MAQESKVVDGITVRVATPAALYALKRHTVRPLDRQDAESFATRIRSGRGVAVTVQRFRTIEEMNAAPVLVRSGEGSERFVRHCARFRKIAPRVYPRGVFRFRTLAEAQAARERIASENCERPRRLDTSDQG